MHTKRTHKHFFRFHSCSIRIEDSLFRSAIQRL